MGKGDCGDPLVVVGIADRDNAHMAVCGDLDGLVGHDGHVADDMGQTEDVDGEDNGQEHDKISDGVQGVDSVSVHCDVPFDWVGGYLSRD